MISSQIRKEHQTQPENCFNLVIEVLLISSPHRHATVTYDHSFNLVIEVLLISSEVRPKQGGRVSWFQSRNRGSFDFKLILRPQHLSPPCFNLVIEVLLISSPRRRGQHLRHHRFNLVIEVLLISSLLCPEWWHGSKSS